MCEYKVSIIVPVYNVEQYISKCLDSLVNQSLNEIEILVINDGSPDNSQSIIDEFVANYPNKVKSFIKPNGGLSDARNYGVLHATGEFLAFVDSDDYVEYDMYEKMYYKALEENSDIVCCGISYMYNTYMTRWYFSNPSEFGVSAKENPNCIVQANSYACMKIYRRSMWVDHHISFPETRMYFEDTATIYGALLFANRISIVNEPLYIYRKTEETSITNSVDEKIFDMFRACKRMIQTYQKNEVYDVYYSQLTFICVKHLFIRIKSLKSHPNKALIKKFVDETFNFLNQHFENWQNCSYFGVPSSGKKKKFYKFIFTNKKRLYFYLTCPLGLRKILGKSLGLTIKVLKKLRKGNLFNNVDIKHKKRKMIQRNGLSVISDTIAILDSIHVTAFADFGTMLGIVRNGKLLDHDLDADIGVFTNGTSIDVIRKTMESYGFKVWRQYFLNHTIIEESYRLKGVKVDLNYYIQNNDSISTYLFYRKPDQTYPDNTRNTVRMDYSPVQEFKTVKVENYSIRIPSNAEQLLEEKYGKNWRTPDTNWIYWQSPAATPIDDIGTYLTWKYTNFPNFMLPIENTTTTKSLSPIYKDQYMQRLHSVELDILKEFKRVCNALNLKYYLAEGTLLGAIRHNGFIPWDDDVDVMMPRKDYERLLNEGSAVFSEEFKIQHYSNISNYWSIFAKIRYIGTSSYYQKRIAHLTKDNGLYIDIFPLDTVPSHISPAQTKQKLKINFLRKALSYKMGDTRPSRLRFWDRKLYGLTHSNQDLYEKLDKTYKELSSEDALYYQNLASYYTRPAMLISKYGEGRMHRFEDDEFCIPTCAEEILTNIYGDYMKLPPVSKQKSKHSFQER